jgi:hypothetical protein
LRKLLVLVSAAGLLVGLSASAAELAYRATTTIRINTFPDISLTGTSVATVNSSSNGSHLTSLFVDGANANPSPQTGTVFVTDPDVLADGVFAVKLSGLQQTTGTFAQFSQGSAPLTLNQVGSLGEARICILSTVCDAANSAVLPLTPPGPNTGAGIGGSATIMGGFGLLVSIVYNPWTKNTISITNVGTDGGGVVTRTVMGFVHGPMSMESSSANLTSAVIQLVQATSTVTKGVSTLPAPNAHNGTFTTMTMHVIPEPGILLLLGSGVAGLAILGHRRLRK